MNIHPSCLQKFATLSEVIPRLILIKLYYKACLFYIDISVSLRFHFLALSPPCRSDYQQTSIFLNQEERKSLSGYLGELGFLICALAIYFEGAVSSAQDQCYQLEFSSTIYTHVAHTWFVINSKTFHAMNGRCRIIDPCVHVRMLWLDHLALTCRLDSCDQNA